MTFREWDEKIAQSREINITGIQARVKIEGRVHADWKAEREVYVAELSACKERVRELEEALRRITLQPQECQRIMAKHGWKYDDSEDFNQKMIFTMYDHVVQCAVEAEQALEAQEQSKEVGG